MNSHDQGLLYACLTIEQRQRLTTRQIHLADVRDAMEQGFKPEPDVALHHLPLLSDEALARFFTESEKWRDKAHERALEERIQTLIKADEELNGYYVNLRQILDALDVPTHFRPIDGNPKHIAWTEQKARELVKKASDSEQNRKAAIDAEQRVDLLGRYVKACDDKRIPYNWNVFKMGTAALRDLVWEHESRERLTNLSTSAEFANLFSERKRQELEQSLHWHAQRFESVRKMIVDFNGSRFGPDTAEALLDALLDRPQTGDQTPAWTTWEWGYAPKDINRDTKLELRLKSGGVVILDSSVVEWSEVEAYRPAK
ncbi:hypothetical protein [Salmonella phage Lumpael]|uniref:Uncharacterized protein n=1 Tax=Salmonella phage Lumpael TaxID=2488859 RepID=A0A3G8F2Z1_9CAUD|nr:hypothetical protein HOU68_gp05 [Salmonella phage Lumpael]AZF88752.1 hypothetical protein [Salmonella phage Lumpael]